MTKPESDVCYHHGRKDPRHEPLIGYWIDVESGGEIVGYVCGNGAEVLKVARSMHEFRDVYRLHYPDAAFIKREPKIDGTRATRLTITDIE